MRLLDETAVLLRLARWGLAMARHDTRQPSPVADNPKFLSPRDAVELIRDGDVVAISGLGTHQRASILFWAIKERFLRGDGPHGITVMNVGGHGSRGLLPGTLDELAQPGLTTRLITSHFETNHPFRDLAAAGKCELQCLPLGVMALLFDARRRGRDSITAPTGIGTFFDPRTGRGSIVRGGREPLIDVAGGQLRFRMPAIDVALFNVPAADRAGNLYVRDCAMIGDAIELSHAARRNGGCVIANVGKIVEPGYDEIFLPANRVDAIVYHPETEQTAGFYHRDPWPAITVRGSGDIGAALDQAHFARWLSEIAGGMSQRRPIDEALFRLAASTLARSTRRGASVVIGAGLPEEVSRVIYEAGRLDDFMFMVETGVIGGLPAPGTYFGASFTPREMISTASFFKRVYRKLDATVLGALEVDEQGNVNVSRRGPGVRSYAGPGGFTDFVTAARTIVFISGWMRGGEIILEGGSVKIRKRGKPKFVKRVSEVTFCAAEALKAGKIVFYATPVGLFRLSERGLELEQAMPGIDVRRDITGIASAKIHVPREATESRIASPIVTGIGFRLPTNRRSR